VGALPLFKGRPMAWDKSMCAGVRGNSLCLCRKPAWIGNEWNQRGRIAACRPPQAVFAGRSRVPQCGRMYRPMQTINAPGEDLRRLSACPNVNDTVVGPACHGADMGHVSQSLYQPSRSRPVMHPGCQGQLVAEPRVYAPPECIEINDCQSSAALGSQQGSGIPTILPRQWYW
jgi:hypothetical protein